MKKLALLALLIAATLALFSCGYGGGSQIQPTTPPPATPSPTTPTLTTPAVNGTVTVVMQNLAFNPSSITIDKGTKVTWTNKDSVPHTVTESKGKFDSGQLGQGGTFSYVFNESGTYNYSCIIHPGIQATVIVK